jgi:ribosomal-protein-alanine N-acetyltransferase
MPSRFRITRTAFTVLPIFAAISSSGLPNSVRSSAVLAADADEWLAVVARTTRQRGQPVHWAIRTADDALIGGCGFDGLQIGKSHRAEVGYWLAKPFWERGIMTAVVKRLCQHAFEDFGLVKITAHVFPHNQGSARVLEKCGLFQQEGGQRHWSIR